MVMAYTQAREYESILQEEFGEDNIQANVTGGLPEDPENFDLKQAKEDFKEQQSEDDDGSYDGPDPQGDAWIEVESDIVRDVVEFLKNTPEDGLKFDNLHCLSADHIPEDDVLVTVYHLYSYENNDWITLKTFVPEDSPVIPSISQVHPIADWHEREAYDMFGIRFTDHPDLRRILLPNDWEGHPLRKDYVFPRYYRGLPVDWDEARENRMSRNDFYNEAEELKEMDIDEELGFTPKQRPNGA